MEKNNDKLVLTAGDFEQAFGYELDSLTKCEVNQHDFTLQRVVGAPRDQLIIEIIEKIRRDSQIVGAPEREAVWESGWRENLVAYAENPDSAQLLPKFLRPGKTVRWQGAFYSPADPNFEINFTRVLRSFVFGQIGKMIDGEINLYEFGAGTGWGLLHAHEWFQQADRAHKLFGSDFAYSSVELIDKMAHNKEIPLEANRFDMREPDYNYSFEKPRQAAVVTLGALEQLAGEVEPMFDYLIAQQPEIVINIEPAAENYDITHLEDYLAEWFQRKRGYTEGIGATLFRKSNEGSLELLASKRLGFGSQMMEGYNLFIWRPRR